jgi:DNA-binding NtrC family response regulator
MRRAVILVADGDGARRRRLCQRLGSDGWDAIEATDAAALPAMVAAHAAAAVVLGSTRGDVADAMAATRALRPRYQQLPIVIVTTHSSESLAIEALRAGATDYFREPLALDDLSAEIRRRLDAGVRAGAVPAREAGGLSGEAPLIGASPAMREIRAYVQRVAATDSNVLITGETGTGKELIAHLIHHRSRRRQRPFVAINCAAMPETLLESEMFGHERGAFTGAVAARTGTLAQADGGTAFFDEIGDMSLHAQAKVLRALESGEVRRLGGRGDTVVDVRIVAATNHDVERSVADGRFRADLYYRLNVARIDVPPLRERPLDIPALLEHYLHQYNRRLGRSVEGFGEDAREVLVRYDWPGNVRELRNAVESSFISRESGRVTVDDLPRHLRQRLRDAGAPPPDTERDRMLAALSATNWNKSRAAARLNWSRMTLYRKLTKHRIVRSTDGARRDRAAG